MLEDLSRTVRFRKWLESLSRGDGETYPDAGSPASDAAAFLARWDQMRKDYRRLEERHATLLEQIAEVAGSEGAEDDEQVLDQLRECIRQLEAAARKAAADEAEKTTAARTELEAARAELDHARAELDQTRSALEKERRKLDPVLRYAYNLRRLLQAIHAHGGLTPQIRTRVEELLAAGGVALETRKAS